MLSKFRITDDNTNKNIYNNLNLYKNVDPELDDVINFFDEYYKPGNKIMEPKNIKKYVGKKKSAFMGFGQQDSEEFINIFLDFLDEKCKLITKNPSTISKLLETKIEKSIKCKVVKCLTVSKSIEITNLINLSINKDTNDLNDCLIEFLKREN